MSPVFVRHAGLANLASCPLPEFISEMFDRCLDWIGRSPSQDTETGGLHSLPEVGQEDEVLRCSLADLNPFENFTTTHRSHPAGRTFPARFVRREGHEVPRQLHHVRLMIVDDDTAMPKNGSGLGKRVIADWNIELRFGKQASQRPTDLHRFEPRTRCHAAAESFQDIMDR